MPKVLALVFATLTIALLCCMPVAPAQISVNIGVAPVCPYGYFDYAPYNCAPYGYYGPDWFVGGVFIGAGPWFHGFRGGRFFDRGFRGGFARGFRGGFDRGFRGGFAARGGLNGGFRGGSG